jgi:hypothetical protein
VKRQHFGNATPFGVEYDAATGLSVIYDRLWRPLVRARGRFPRCQWGTALACDPSEPRIYGIEQPTLFYRADANSYRCDAAVRGRLAELYRKCPALRDECERRADATVIANQPPPEQAREGADLIRHTFGEAAA